MKKKIIAFFAMTCMLMGSVGNMAVFAEEESPVAAEVTETETTTPETTTPETTTPETTTPETTTPETTTPETTTPETATPETTTPETTTPETATPEVPAESYDCTGKYVNIALVVDTTGSMYYDIETVKANLTTFVKEIAASGAIPRIALIEYKDIQCDGMESTAVHTTPDFSVWYDDAEQMVAEIATLEVYGGGDIPESLVDALGYVVNDDVMTFNKYAAKFAIVLTDAGYNEANRWGITGMDDMINRLNAKGIQTTVVTHKDDYTYTWDDETESYLRDTAEILLSEEYADLTSKTGGIIIDMSEDFATELSKYAKAIIAKTASTEVDSSYVPVTGITLGSDVSVATEGVYKFPITINPENATVKDIIWSVEDETVATINRELTNSEYCVVNAVSEGSTTLVAKTADGGYTAYFTLTVKDVVDDGATATTCKADKVVSVLTTSTATKVLLVSDEATGTKIDVAILKDIFTTLKDTGKDIEFTFTDAVGTEVYSWTFSGGKITDTSAGISSFKIDPDARVADVESAIAAVKPDAVFEEIHFDHEGTLPGTATITTKTDIKADKAYLYYYNPTTKKLELVSSDVKIKDGCATFDIEHCSDYVLSTSELVPNTAPTTKSPKTGESDAFGMASAYVVLLAGVCVCAYCVRRKKVA